MEVRAAERRSTRRLQFKTALHVRVWKSGPTERRAESVNLSETGAFFRHRCAYSNRVSHRNPPEDGGGDYRQPPPTGWRGTWCASSGSIRFAAICVGACSSTTTKSCRQRPMPRFEIGPPSKGTRTGICEIRFHSWRTRFRRLSPVPSRRESNGNSIEPANSLRQRETAGISAALDSR